MDLRTKVFVLLERMFCFVFCFCFLVKKRTYNEEKKTKKTNGLAVPFFVCNKIIDYCGLKRLHASALVTS